MNVELWEKVIVVALLADLLLLLVVFLVEDLANKEDREDVQEEDS